MEKIEIKIRRISRAAESLPLPHYETEGAAGMDVAAAIDTDVILEPGAIIVVPTGFAFALPSGFEMQVRPRSGLAMNHGITLINSPGTIDADYRGEVKIGLINHGSKKYTIKHGDRIAQLIVARVTQARLTVVSELDSTARNHGGFGHTGM